VAKRTPEAPCPKARDFQRHRQPHHPFRQRLADTGRMRQNQLALQRREVLVGNAHRGELPEAGVDPVDGRVASQDRLDG
jgi:hypothetical protein